MLPRYEGGMTFSGPRAAPKPPGKWPPARPGWVGGPPDKVPRMKWLAEGSPAARREALRAVAPEPCGHYQQLTGRQLSANRVMAWHLRQALGRSS